MITNLVAVVIVTLATNTTERFPTHAVVDPSPMSADGLQVLAVMRSHQEPDANPTNKWVRTIVKEVTTASFVFNGEEKSVSDEKVISDNEVFMALQQTWQPITTNEVLNELHSVNGWVISTNTMATNYMILPQ